MSVPLPSSLIDALEGDSPVEAVRVWFAYYPHRFFLDMIGCLQGKDHHPYDVWGHSLDVLGRVSEQSKAIHARFAALVHDIAKPPCRKQVGEIISFKDHDSEAPEMIRKFAEEGLFVLPEQYPDKEEIIEAASVVASEHMHACTMAQDPKAGDRALLRFARRCGKWLDLVLLVSDADHCGHLNVDTNVVKAFKARIQNLMATNANIVEKLPEFIGGNWITQNLHIPPGPQIREIKAKLKSAWEAGEVSTEEDARKFMMNGDRNVAN